jgi:CheY-like chemotaxis protein
MIKGRPINILLVEDDPAHAEIVRRNLANFRVANKITLIKDGQAALDYFFHQGAYADPELSIIPDIILLERLKEDKELKHIPTVVLTTSSAESDMVNAYENGAGSYLVKPVDFDKFTKLMDAFGFYWLAWNTFPE